jgi:hypothetical protein
LAKQEKQQCPDTETTTRAPDAMRYSEVQRATRTWFAAHDKKTIGVLNDLLHLKIVGYHACSCFLWHPPAGFGQTCSISLLCYVV